MLAGGSVADVGAAADVLAPLAAEVRHIGDPRAAAAAKLVANASLAGSALALRHVLEGAALLGLSLPDALDILELGRLGELVRGSRERLDPAAPARRSSRRAPSPRTQGCSPTRPGPRSSLTGCRRFWPAARSTWTTTSASWRCRRPTGRRRPVSLDAVLAPLHDYARGHATGDAAYFRRAFLPTAHVEGLCDGAFRRGTSTPIAGCSTGSPRGRARQESHRRGGARRRQRRHRHHDAPSR